MLLGTVVLGGMFYAACYLLDNNKDDNIELINSVLKSNLSIKEKDKEIHPYVKSCKGNGTYIVELQKGFDFTQLEKLRGKIENAIKCNVSINNDDFIYSIKMEKAVETPTLVPFKLVYTKAKDGVKLAIGVRGDEIIYIDFKSVPHLLIGGATGWGKSIFTKGLILQILHNYPSSELELFDFKAGIELGDFKDLKQTKTFIVKPHEASDEIERIYNEIEQRFDVITNAKCRDIFEYNSKSNNKMQYRFVIIEEFTILLDIQEELSVILTKALAIARATGTYFIFTSQRFSADIIDSKIKANIDNRVCFHVADSMNSKIILDSPGAEQLQHKGRAILSQSGQKQEFQSFYATKSDIERMTKRYFEDKKAIKVIEEVEGEKMIWE